MRLLTPGVACAVVLAAALTASTAPAQLAPGPQPPTPWFVDPPGEAPSPPGAPPAQTPPPSGDGAYVQVPPPVPAPPAANPVDPLAPHLEPQIEYPDESTDGELVMVLIAVRPWATYVGEGPRASDPETLVAGHVGLHAHGTGVEDEIIGRADLSGFIGASSEGVEGEGRAFLSIGLAKAFSGRNHVMFRFGAGGALFGNPVVDYQVAELPALELGYVSTADGGIFEIAPRVAMGVLQMSAFGAGELAPDPAPAVGGRVLAGSESLWGTIDYELVTGEKPVQIGALTGCYANKLAVCIEGRMASASLDFGPDTGRGAHERVNAVSGGFTIGLGEIEIK